jgi:hypothetical protein
MSKPDPPTPPNPVETARASTSTNVATGVANAFLNNVNQVTPQGSLNYSQTGSYNWNDPVTGTSYNIPTFTATQTLSPQQKAIQGQTEATQFNLAGMANSQSQRISKLLGHEMDTSGIPQAGDPNAIKNVGQAATSFDTGGPLQTSFDAGGPIKSSYAPEGNYSQDRQRVEDSLMQRMNPQLELERKGVEQRLADQGIRYGSQAYTSAMDDYNRQSNDARFAAIGQAGAEQQRMNAMTAQEAAFQNQAQQQQYEQNQGLASFGNQALGQTFQQNAALASFGNAGLAQQMAQAQSGFNADQAARNAALQELYTSRNQPINEITSLLSGSQIQNPNFVNTPGSQIATTDIGGLVNQNFQNQMSVYGQQNQNWQQLMGGVLGLGAGAMKASDERMKEDIDRVGTVFAFDEDAERKKLPIYEYQYKDDPASLRHVGPMAQDVKKVDPKAVSNVKTPAGKTRMAIDTRRVMGNILKAA